MVFLEVNFKSLYQKGKCQFDEIHHYLEAWFNGKSTLSLREFLGLSDEEFLIWLAKGDEALKKKLRQNDLIKLCKRWSFSFLYLFLVFKQ